MLFCKANKFHIDLGLTCRKKSHRDLKTAFLNIFDLENKTDGMFAHFHFNKSVLTLAILAEKITQRYSNSIFKTNGKFAQLHFTINSQCGKYLIKVDLYLV